MHVLLTQLEIAKEFILVYFIKNLAKCFNFFVLRMIESNESDNKENIEINKTKILDQPIENAATNNALEFTFSENPSLERLRSIQSKFIKDRNWSQFQTPRNLLLALVNEVGELAEIFQWKGTTKLFYKLKIN